VLLFLDILGTRSVWSREGVAGAANVFDRFRALIRSEARKNPSSILSGAIESDSAALVCVNASEAIALGTALYRAAFFQPSLTATRGYRMWLRGVIAPVGDVADVAELRTSRRLAKDLPRVTVETYSNELLDAISAEKAGFKGMRLLIQDDLVVDTVRAAHQLKIGARSATLHPFRNLDHSSYPTRLAGHLDVLWMASEDEDEWRTRRNRMSSRIRFSARDTEEVLQAAATQVVFDECDAIMTSLRTRATKTRS
jgi:hypothetical protein